MWVAEQIQPPKLMRTNVRLFPWLGRSLLPGGLQHVNELPTELSGRSIFPPAGAKHGERLS